VRPHRPATKKNQQKITSGMGWLASTAPPWWPGTTQQRTALPLVAFVTYEADFFCGSRQFDRCIGNAAFFYFLFFKTPKRAPPRELRKPPSCDAGAYRLTGLGFFREESISRFELGGRFLIRLCDLVRTSSE
jgi:hypothetical protein